MENGEPRGMDRTEPLSLFQLLVLCLSVFVLAALAAETFLPLRPEVRGLLLHLDTAICLVFLADSITPATSSASSSPGGSSTWPRASRPCPPCAGGAWPGCTACCGCCAPSARPSC